MKNATFTITTLLPPRDPLKTTLSAVPIKLKQKLNSTINFAASLKSEPAK